MHILCVVILGIIVWISVIPLKMGKVRLEDQARASMFNQYEFITLNIVMHILLEVIFGHHCVDISNCIENAQSTIVTPMCRFNFQSSEIRFFEHCNAHFISSNFWHQCVDISNCVQNAQTTIVRPS